MYFNNASNHFIYRYNKNRIIISKEKLIFIIGIIVCVTVSVVVGVVFNSVKICGSIYYDYLDEYNIKKIEEISKTNCKDINGRFISIIIIELIFCGVVYYYINI